MNLRGYLEQMVTLRASADETARRDGWRYSSIEAMVLDLGREFVRAPKPRAPRMGPVKLAAPR